MKIMREEPYSMRVMENGDIVLTAAFIRRLLTENAGDNKKGLAEDLEDFGGNKVVVVGLAECESGTEFTIARDRRKEPR